MLCEHLALAAFAGHVAGQASVERVLSPPQVGNGMQRTWTENSGKTTHKLARGFTDGLLNINICYQTKYISGYELGRRSCLTSTPTANGVRARLCLFLKQRGYNALVRNLI